MHTFICLQTVNVNNNIFLNINVVIYIECFIIHIKNINYDEIKAKK